MTTCGSYYGEEGQSTYGIYVQVGRLYGQKRRWNAPAGQKENRCRTECIPFDSGSGSGYGKRKIDMYLCRK